MSMNILDWKTKHGSAKWQELADKCDTSTAYLRQIGTKNRNASHQLCFLIEKHTDGEVSRFDLRPDIFGEQPELAQSA